MGHLNLIGNAKTLRLWVVGVNADDLVGSCKTKTDRSLEEKGRIVQAIEYVDEVIVTTTLDKKQVWEKVHFNEIYIGDDWKNNARLGRRTGKMEELGANFNCFCHIPKIHPQRCFVRN